MRTIEGVAANDWLGDLLFAEADASAALEQFTAITEDLEGRNV
jgi:hypothetical protein